MASGVLMGAVTDKGGNEVTSIDQDLISAAAVEVEKLELWSKAKHKPSSQRAKIYM